MRKNIAKKALSLVLAAGLALTPTTALASSYGSTGELTTQQSQKNSTVAGVGQSSIGGSYAATSVNGIAITTPAATVASNIGVGAGERAVVQTWDVTAKGSPAAMRSLEIAAGSVGAKLGPAVEICLNKRDKDGKFVALLGQGGRATTTIGIPSSFRGAGQYAVVRVISGGWFEILQDKDSNPDTVTIDIAAGNGAYAIISY